MLRSSVVCLVGCTVAPLPSSTPDSSGSPTSSTGSSGSTHSGPTSATSATGTPPVDELAALDDTFENSATLADWQRVWVVEEWPGDQLEVIDIDTSVAGSLWMQPYASGWFGDYRGALAFKEVDGDFVVTTSVHVTDRRLKAAPGASFSLAGILVRAPRAITAETWTAGGENYVFLSQGARQPGQYSGEIKTTVDSQSTLRFPPGAAQSRIRIARIGEHVICLLDVGEGWTVASWRYRRADFPSTLQVGLTAYTDWNTVDDYAPAAYNQTVLTEVGTPDLVARFEGITFRRPDIPKPFVGADLSNPDAVSDAELLSFLGDVADVVP